MTHDAEFDSLAASIVASALVSTDDWASVSASAGGSSSRLKELLIGRGLLTRFQLDALAEGRGASLRVGNYDILDRLGAGGMGTVYKARHRRMKRLVALKILTANLTTNPVFVKRFQREVETIACLGHPNVVMAYDADEADVGHFLVMEYVSGRDLAACVAKDGPMSVAKAVDCILQAARGLAYAHSQEIVHRDIKPHNLLLDESGVVKITDLGLARLQHETDGGAAQSDVTAAGVVVGTADYMPPEQAFDPDTLDSRADTYSLGCTLYFLLAGKPPYVGSSIVAILMKHREAEIPSLADSAPGVPARLESLFRRMVAKRPSDRIATMSEVVKELEAVARELGMASPAAPASIASHSAHSIHSLGYSLGPTPATHATDVTPSMTAPIGAQTVELASLGESESGASSGILVVEPSRVQASIIKTFLGEHSHSVVATVTNGREAIEAIHRLRPAAVVSTMHLSDLNGLQLAEQIRREIRVAPPGFVLVTTEAMEGERAGDALSRLNRVTFLRKPFTSTQLGEALSSVMGATKEQSLGTLATALQETGLHDLGATSEIPSPRKERSQLRVLIVDDSATARANIRTVLQGLGIVHFLEVPDGAYAIAVAAREICDLIVTDYNMPLMDGRALVSYLKQNPATTAIPIVMVTTETDPRILDPVRRLGVVAILEKAFPASVVGPLLASLFG